MITDKFGQQIFSEDEICDLFYTNPDITFKQILTDCEIEYPDVLELQNIPNIIKYNQPNLSIEEFDSASQQNWYMPIEYKEMDIAAFILEQCKTDAELQRVGQELILFQERDMFDLLKYLKYLVDTMRKNNIVWGVGRGSSVASFVLFLLGVHRINSLYYDLSIDEFLK